MVLFVGRISQEKGVDKILEVWSGICHEEKYKEWQLVIIGDGEKREQLEKYAIDMKLINYSFEGFQKPVTIKQRFFVWLHHLKALDWFWWRQCHMA